MKFLRKNFCKNLLLITVIGIATLPFLSLAQTQVQISPEVTLPSINGTSPTSGPAEYVQYIFKLALGFAGALAFAMIVIGGIQIATSGGNTSQVDDGKDRIRMAILGLLLLLFSVLILRTINPNLVQLQDITLQNISAPQPPPGGAGAPGVITPQQGQCYTSSYAYACVAQNGSIPGGANSCWNVSNCNNQCPSGTTCKALGGQIVPSGQCKNCVNIASELGSSWVKDPSILSNQALVKKLVDLRTYTQSAPWKVTEGFPPTVHHSDPNHSNGCAVDIALNTSPTSSSDCPSTVDLIIRTAQNVGFSNVLNEYYQYCGGKKFDTTQGENIHLDGC